VRRPRSLAAVATAALVGAVSCSGSFGMPRGATEQGRETFELWQIFFVAALVVGAIVYGLIAWSLVRYRRRGYDDPEAIGALFRESRRLEAVYVAIPVAIVIGLFALSLRTETDVTRIDPDPAVRVDVEAFAWGWRFTYPDLGVTVLSEPSGPGVPGPEMVVPLGETTRIRLSSRDVVHAFWVPGFLFKRDATPGRTQTFDVTPVESGTFAGACSEFCGLNHAYMRFSVRVVSPDAFEAWAAAAPSEAT
jgi:cytochrome c oxidase subunit II